MKPFSLGTIAGIRITAHPSWLVLLGLFTTLLATGWFPQALPGFSSGIYWLTGFVAALLLFASVLAHELAHALVAKARGVPVKQILLYFFGGAANLEEEPQSPGVEFQITIVGPLTSLVIGVLAWLAQGLVLSSAPLVAVTLVYLALMNGILAIFNLLPGFPLDGGRILRSILWKLTGSVRTATIWSAEVGQYMAFLLILLGIWLAFTGQVLSGLWLGLIGWFLLTAAQAARIKATRERDPRAHRVRDVRVEQAMRPVLLVVSPGMTVQDLIETYMAPRKLLGVPVMEGDQLVGFITLAQIQQVPTEEWGQTVVGQIMDPRHSIQTVSPQQPLQEVLAFMDHHEISQALVMQDDRLVGSVSRDTIARFLEMLQGLGRAGVDDPLPKAS
jgi:Zn-dependent protease/CBS domain-containing protein